MCEINHTHAMSLAVRCKVSPNVKVFKGALTLANPTVLKYSSTQARIVK